MILITLIVYVSSVYENVVTCRTLQVLGVADRSDVDVVKELRSRLEAAGLVATSSSMTQNGESISAAVAAETAKYESTIAELKTNNEQLRAKLKAVYKSSQEAKQRHSKDVAKLQKTVAELHQRAREKQTAETEGAGARTSGGADGNREIAATSAEGRGGVVFPPVNVASSQVRRPSLSYPQATSAGDRDHSSPTSPVVMPPLALHKTSTTTTARAAPPTTAVVLPSLALDTSAYQPNANEHSSTSLHSQVGH